MLLNYYNLNYHYYIKVYGNKINNNNKVIANY